MDRNTAPHPLNQTFLLYLFAVKHSDQNYKLHKFMHLYPLNRNHILIRGGADAFRVFIKANFKVE